MRRTVLLALALLTAVGGCAHSHTRKPAAELRAGIPPTTTRVEYDASYALICTDRPNEPLLTAALVRGESVGFQKQKDSPVVAVAGKQTFPLADGDFAWVLVVGTEPSRGEQVAEDVRQVCRAAFDTVGTILMIPLFVLFVPAGARFG